MLKKNIIPLDLNEMEEDEIEHRAKTALEDYVAFWEEHGPFLLTKGGIYKELSNYYDYASDYLLNLERDFA